MSDPHRSQRRTRRGYDAANNDRQERMRQRAQKDWDKETGLREQHSCFEAYLRGLTYTFTG